MSKAIKLTIGAVALTTSLGTLWFGAQVSQSCQAHEFEIVRNFTDAQAVSQLQDTKGQVVWQGQGAEPAATVITVTKPQSGQFTFVTQFSNGTTAVARTSAVTDKAPNQHSFTVNDTAASYTAKPIGLSFSRTLSCIDGE